MALTDLSKFGIATGAGSLGAGIGSLFSGFNNPADSSMDYINNIPKNTSPYYQPYITAGQQSLNLLQPQFQNLISNPGQKLNDIGSMFQQSPGFKFALQQALQAGNHAAAAGGMAGSPENIQKNMELATNLSNQDYYNWLNPALNLYNSGLQGLGGMSQQGFQASKSLSDEIAQALAQQAAYQYQGQAAENESTGSGWGNLISGAGMLAAFL